MARDKLDKLVLDRETEEAAIKEPGLTGALEGVDLGLPDLGLGRDGMPRPGKSSDGGGITPNRESNFNKRSGRFHDPGTGKFEEGSPPPDLDPGADRYRGKNGRFKKASADLYDEEEEVLLDSLDPEG